MRLGIANDALAILGPHVDYRRMNKLKEPGNLSFPEKEAGASECVDVLRQRLGDDYREPDVFWRIPW